MKPPVVRYERRKGATWIIFNRPEAANAMNMELLAATREALGRARAEKTRALVFSGSGGKAFCAGADLKERKTMTLDQTRAFLDELASMIQQLATLPCLTLAAIDGVALGGGMEVALACDLRVCSERSTFALPEVRLGIIPGAGGTQRLPRLIGLARAKELILLGRRVSAHEALDYGLVSRVAHPEEIDNVVAEKVASFEAASPLAVAKAKEALDVGFDLPIQEALSFERRCYETTLMSWDRNEGLAAFVEGRKPAYRGE